MYLLGYILLACHSQAGNMYSHMMPVISCVVWAKCQQISHFRCTAQTIAGCDQQVLVLVPMRNMALKCILRLLQFTQKETRADSIQGKQRFLDDFGPGDDAADEEELTERGKRVKKQQPAEHQALFDGNSDDHFRIGIKITRWEYMVTATVELQCTLDLSVISELIRMSDD